jgi:hypothetical protein
MCSHTASAQAGFEVKEHFDFMAYGDKLYAVNLLSI